MQRILAIHYESLSRYSVKTLYNELLTVYISVNKQDLMFVALETFLIFSGNSGKQAVQA